MQGVIGEFMVRQNIFLLLQVLCGWLWLLLCVEFLVFVEIYVEVLYLDLVDFDCIVVLLFGGIQQKVMLVCVLVVWFYVLIFDELISGIDIGVKFDVQWWISQLVGDGVVVVFIFLEFEEVVCLSDCIVVLKDCEKIGEFSNGLGVMVDIVVEMIVVELSYSVDL